MNTKCHDCGGAGCDRYGQICLTCDGKIELEEKCAGCKHTEHSGHICWDDDFCMCINEKAFWWEKK